MEIQESIIHGVKKSRETQGEGSVVIDPRETVLPVDERLANLGGEVLTLYSRFSNGYGVVGGNEQIHRFPIVFEQYISGAIDLVEFSRITCDLISASMKDRFLATTSWPLFVRYTNQGRDWFLIAMLKLKEGVGIDEETLDLNDSLSFDVSHLHEAARIDIEKWANNEQPYLSFIKRGSGDSDVSQYFRAAISCTDYTDARHNTEATVKALNDFLISSAWEPEECQRARDQLYAYCVEVKAADQPVNMTSLSSRISNLEPDAFINYVRDNDYEISEVYSPNPATYKKLKRVSKRFGNVSVSFDVSDLRDEIVYYDAQLNALVLTNPPVELIAEIEKALGTANAADE